MTAAPPGHTKTVSKEDAMSQAEWDVGRMERERIARFSELKTDPRFFLDSMLPGPGNKRLLGLL